MNRGQDTTPRFAYDLFVSYAHADDHDGWVSALVASIRAEHATFTSTPMYVFFDREEIRTMHDWEHRIYRGLRHAKLMLVSLDRKPARNSDRMLCIPLSHFAVGPSPLERVSVDLVVLLP